MKFKKLKICINGHSMCFLQIVAKDTSYWQKNGICVLFYWQGNIKQNKTRQGKHGTETFLLRQIWRLAEPVVSIDKGHYAGAPEPAYACGMCVGLCFQFWGLWPLQKGVGDRQTEIMLVYISKI